jgi:hypothetical protein
VHLRLIDALNICILIPQILFLIVPELDLRMWHYIVEDISMISCKSTRAKKSQPRFQTLSSTQYITITHRMIKVQKKTIRLYSFLSNIREDSELVSLMETRPNDWVSVCPRRIRLLSSHSLLDRILENKAAEE